MTPTLWRPQTQMAKQNLRSWSYTVNLSAPRRDTAASNLDLYIWHKPFHYPGRIPGPASPSGRTARDERMLQGRGHDRRPALYPKHYKCGPKRLEHWLNTGSSKKTRKLTQTLLNMGLNMGSRAKDAKKWKTMG